MTRRAFIHIGTHKTGSSYLQRWLHVNRVRLRGLGLGYMRTGMSEDDRSHKNLSRRLIAHEGDLLTDPTWARLAAEVAASPSDVVLSSELLSGIADPAIVQRLAAFFSRLGCTPVFIVFFRDIPAYFNSRYAQDTKNLRVQDGFAAYVARLSTHRAYDYPRLLRPFEAAGEVRALPYRPDGAPLEQLFLSALAREPSAVAAQTWTPVGKLNPSFSAEALALARKVAGALPDGLSTEDILLKRTIFKDACTRYDLGATRFVGCDAAFAETLRQRFAAKTDAVARSYFDQPWPQAVPPETLFHSYDATEQARTAPQELQDLITDTVLNGSALRFRFLRTLRAIRGRLRSG